MYEYADRIIKLLNRKIVREYSRIRSLADFDEINVLGRVTEAYEEIYAAISEHYLRLAEGVYEDASGRSAKKRIDKKFIAKILAAPDPVSMYIFDSEFDRKRLRLAEAVIASGGSEEETARSMRLLSSMAALYAVTVTDKAALKGYADSGVKSVRWVCEADEKTCGECRKRGGKVYPTDKVPPKPHINCRCWLEPADKK